MAQFSYPVYVLGQTFFNRRPDTILHFRGTVLEGRPGAQPPIFNDMGGIMANPSMQPAGSPDLLSQAYSQSHGGVVAASSSHHGRVPLATIVTAVPPVDLGSSSSEDIPNTNDPHFYSSPVAMEPPRGFMEQPKPSTPPAKARNKSSPRIHAAKIEKSTNIGHWTDGLVKPPPPLPPRNRTRSQDATTSSRASARSRGSQDSRTTMQSSDQRPSSSANHRITAQRMPELPHFGGIDVGLQVGCNAILIRHLSQTTIQMPGLEPLLEELNPNGLQPVTIPSHIHQFSSSNTMGTSPPSDPRAQSSGYIAGSLVSLPSSADSPPPITYASNQASWPGQCIPQRRRTDGPLHAGVSSLYFELRPRP